MNTLIIFIIASIVNVILQTIKVIVTVKCGKWVTSITNAIVYGFYTWVLVLMSCPLSLWAKILITAGTNFLGVWIVKYVEEKGRKDKLWKVEVAIPNDYSTFAAKDLRAAGISSNSQVMRDWTMFNCYCMKKEETAKVKEIAVSNKGKYSAFESKM